MARTATGDTRDQLSQAKARIVVDGRELEVDEGKLLIEAAIEHGIYIPHFCWHPRLRSVAMCRMCLVEVEGVRGLPPACTTPVRDGMVVSTTSDAVRQAQESVLEFLLINHPLDCPVCDKGGECPLQDQTMAFGPGESRFVEEKRHYEKPIPISSLVLLDRERCILCARCTRFADEIAGHPLISFVGRGNSTQILNFPDEPFSSYFSGNTVEICPVGALTAVPYRFKARPWDLEEVQSSCVQCAVGCRVAVQSSSGRLVRFLGVDSEAVNQGWLCDKGRFSFEATHSPRRLSRPQVRRGGELVDVSWGEALDYCAGRIEEIAQRHGPRAIGFLGGSRSTNESAYAFARLARGVIGTPDVDAQLDDALNERFLLGSAGGGRATFDDLDSASCIVLIGGDLLEELPVAYLRVLGAARRRSVPLIEISTRPTGLSRWAEIQVRVPVGSLAYTVWAIAKAVGETSYLEVFGVDKSSLDQAIEVLKYPKRAGKPVIVVLREDLATAPGGLEEAAASLADATQGKIMPCAHRSNVFGALWAGMSPTTLPGGSQLDDGEARSRLERLWGAEVPAVRGRRAREILEAAALGELKAIVLVGSDPLGDFPYKALAARALETVDLLVSVDAFSNASNSLAHVRLPATAPGESAGSFMNLEGRLLWLEQKVRAYAYSRPEWYAAAELAERLGVLSFPSSFGELQAEMLEACGVSDSVSPGKLALASLHRSGILVSDSFSRYVPEGPVSEPPRLDRYKLRLLAPRKLYGNGVVNRACESLEELAPEPVAALSVRDAERLGVAAGDRLRLVSADYALEIACRPDPDVPEGCVVLPFNSEPEEGSVTEGETSLDLPQVSWLLDPGQEITEVSVETLDGAPARGGRDRD